jgi:glycosyltransferase involved in cell wall biosynthesis
MKFSLILCTINRTEELSLLLESLKRQSFRSFELIVVDQNTHDETLELIRPYTANFSIKYLKSSPGLSKSRNVGLSEAQGDIVSFPDDDCFYSDSLLAEVAEFIDNEKFDGVCICQKNSLNNGVSLPVNSDGELTTKAAFAIGSISIFLKRAVIDSIGPFDEKLGLGASTPFIGGEDADLLVRALKAGYRIYRKNSFIVFHPAYNIDLSQADEEYKGRYKRRFIGNGAADYYIYKNHFSLPQRLRILANNCAMMVVNLMRGRKKAFKNHVYRIKGFAVTIRYFRSL